MKINTDELPCLAPFCCLNTRFDTYSICCASSYLVEGKYVKNKDIFNSYIFRKLRRAMITKEKIPYECQYCIKSGMPNQNFDFDKYSIKEIAQQNIDSMDEDYYIKDFKLATLYVSMDRVCNLSCRMCNSCSSTLYEAHISKVANEIFGIKNKVPKNKDVIHDVIENINLSHLKKMEFQGGELSLSKDFLHIVDKLPDARMDVITNGNILNMGFLKKLKRFSELVIKVSLDGDKRVSEYIRCGSDYNKTVENIKEIYRYLKNSKIEIAITISKYNIFNLIEAMNSFANYSEYISNIRYHYLIDNPSLSIYSMNEEMRKKAILKLTSGKIRDNRLKSQMIEIVKQVQKELSDNKLYDGDGTSQRLKDNFDKKVDAIFHLEKIE